MRLAAGLVCVGALALAGCGAESPSAADRYRVEANAICDRAEEHVEAELADAGELRGREERIRARPERAFEQLIALRPPPGLAAAHAQLEEAGRGMIALGTAARANPQHGNTLRRRYDELAREGYAAMAQLGITGC